MKEKNSPGVRAPEMEAAVPERAHQAERAHDLHQRLGELVGPVVLQGEAHQPVVDVVEALLLERFAAEGLDDLRACERLLQHHVQLGDLLL